MSVHGRRTMCLRSGALCPLMGSTCKDGHPLGQKGETRTRKPSLCLFCAVLAPLHGGGFFVRKDAGLALRK